MKLTRLALAMLAALAAASICAPAARAATLEGNLYYTTFAGTDRVYTVHYLYTVGTSIVYSGITPLIALDGADGIMFNPTNGNLLIGEQDQNKVAQITTAGIPANPFEVMAASDGGSLQAFDLIATPDKSAMLVLPNEPGTLGGDSVVTMALTPLLTAGTTRAVTGPDTSLTAIDWMGGTAYYGDATDHQVNGHLGVFDPVAFTTTELTIVDAVDGTAVQGALPTHGVTFDPFSGNLIICSRDQIWQVSVSGDTATIIGKVTTADPVGHWDQVSLDGAGHLFGANSDGNVIFIDYSASKMISSPVFRDEEFLTDFVDDIVNSGFSGRMTGGGSVFTADGTRVTHGFQMHCDAADVPNSLEVNWGRGNRFHLDTVASSYCYIDPNINSDHPTAPFNTFVGNGTGTYNGVSGATITWTFTDAGEPGTNDMATIAINDANGVNVLTVSGNLKNGNQQAHIDNQ